MSGDGDEDSCEDVVPCVRDHSGAKTPTIDGKQREENAINDDDDHATDAFVSMRGAEKQG